MQLATFRGAMLALSLLLALGCGSESPSNPDQQRIIAGFWLVDGDPFHSFEFVDDAGAAANTDFHGEEDFGGDLSALTGNLDGSQVSLVVDRQQGADPVAFFGIFTDDHTIHINSDDESYILTRDLDD